MGHRHLFGSSQIIETDNDQDWNNPEQAYIPIAISGAPEGNTSVYPAESMVVDGGNLASQWNLAPRSGYPPGGLNGEFTHYQPQAPHPPHDPFLHPSAAGSVHVVHENYPFPASSSNHGGQTFHGVDGGVFGYTVVSGRGPYKRKSPGENAVCDRGSTSRYYDAGSSSMSMDSWQEKQVSDRHQTPWDLPPSNRGHSLSIGSEETPRNVRSRAAFDMEGNLSRSHLTHHSHNSITSLRTDHSSSTDLWIQSPNPLTGEWNNSRVNSAAHGRAYMPDASVFGHENHFNGVNNNPSAALEIGGYHGDYTLHRNHISQNIQGIPSQSVRGVRSNYTQRSSPTFRASSSNLRPGYAATSSEGLQVVSESYPGRHSRPFHTAAFRDWSGRSRMSSDRYRSFPDGVVLGDRLTPEGLMIVDRSALYGSRSLFDQHRDMRLDIDSMTYEDLLALEERIGNVNTGVSDELIPKCMTESVFHSSDQSLEEGKCVICLEEYKNMDDVGTLKLCSHDFHVECIRKWLSLKNLCPICKAAALDDKINQN